ncbi:Biofilm dispersion protein BdlA [Posidoniimonas polymericola]|uniref:Biofilm dispersion protein BdlA n=1 Tax=Posidoniimonas polymericola TaxID=2528002 RepID=A0A5C5YHZ7_9BACT|nr:methyl-accepting chemotaxis protein [Posidoniimonas polymericola]TWT73812.1 Biofilm dispersion protein BdlA [Posidoniimonas polymericola]
MSSTLFKSRNESQAPAAVAEAPHNDAQAVLDALSRSQAVIEFKPDGTIITANDNFLAVLGYNLREVEGSHHRMFCDGQYTSSPEYSQFWRDLAAGRPAVGEYERFTKSGESVWISASYNPVLDANGQCYKVVKIASDITATKRESADSARLANMVANMPINVMFADRDLNVRYMNPASLKTLKQVEHLLPIPADKILGSNIDIFHKDPSYQRGVLAKESNLPVHTQITLGEEILDLLVSAITDKAGNYIGAMATWSIVTEQVRTREEAASVGQTVAASTTEMAATIEEISKSVGRTASLATQTENHVRDSSSAAEMLQESSKAIGKVVGVIQELADQTNLLALNATIEAARAGESGRSFAVVANEVKELAQETGNATQSIEKSVEEMRQRIDQVTGATQQITESIAEVSSNTNTVAAAIEEQSITMAELSKTAEGLVKLANKT